MARRSRGASDVVGRGCGFLQGEATDAAAVEVIREAIRSHEAVNVTLRNYRRDGTPFLTLLSLSPVFDARGLCRYMVGALTEVLPQYVGMKPQLRQADRLHKMLPRRLPMPSSADAETSTRAVPLLSPWYATAEALGE